MMVGIFLQRPSACLATTMQVAKITEILRAPFFRYINSPYKNCYLYGFSKEAD